MKFELNDGGRSLSKRPKQKNDCTVRALALATNSPYDATYEFLAEQGRKCTKGFHLETLLTDASTIGFTVIGCCVKKHSFPATAGQPRMNVERFLIAYPKGRYILRMSKHVACVKDGVLLDTFDCRGGQKCVYTAFEVV